MPLGTSKYPGQEVYDLVLGQGGAQASGRSPTVPTKMESPQLWTQCAVPPNSQSPAQALPSARTHRSPGPVPRVWGGVLGWSHFTTPQRTLPPHPLCSHVRSLLSFALPSLLPPFFCLWLRSPKCPRGYPILHRVRRMLPRRPCLKVTDKHGWETHGKQLCTWMHLSTMLWVNPSDFFFALLILRDKKEEMFTFQTFHSDKCK